MKKSVHCQKWSPNQFWKSKLVPLANFGPPQNCEFTVVMLASYTYTFSVRLLAFLHKELKELPTIGIQAM